MLQNNQKQTQLKNKKEITLDDDQRVYFRNLFRDARAKAQKNAEDFQDILFTVEMLGVTLVKPSSTSQSGLGQYQGIICKLAEDSSLSYAQKDPWHISFSDLYDLVREYRNDALHQGAVARNLTSRAVRLALIIEDALMSNSNLVKHFMVPNVIIAKTWHPLSMIRQQMLENSFSYLPFFDAGTWFLIADYQIAQYIRISDQDLESEKDRLQNDKLKKQDVRIKRLSESLSYALENGLLSGKDQINHANTCSPYQPVDVILGGFTEKPYVVTDEHDASIIYGIVTAFDIL